MSGRCAFCSIVRGDARADVVLDESHAVAFLDHRPLFHGHVLLCPREHHETLADLPPEQVAPLFATARLLSSAVPAAVGAQGSFVALNNRVSQSVPHMHVHVVPRVRGDGLRGFFWPRTSYSGEEQARATATAIRAALESSR